MSVQDPEPPWEELEKLSLDFPTPPVDDIPLLMLLMRPVMRLAFDYFVRMICNLSSLLAHGGLRQQELT